MVFSPSWDRSIAARRLRPISRLISCVRPPMRPRTDSRSERVCVERGSIAYSAVTQPRPEPLRQRGTPSVALAATSTRVPPNSMRHEPSAWSSQPRVIETGRSWSAARPSGRVTRGRLPASHQEQRLAEGRLPARLEPPEQRDHRPVVQPEQHAGTWPTLQELDDDVPTEQSDAVDVPEHLDLEAGRDGHGPQRPLPIAPVVADGPVEAAHRRRERRHQHDDAT